MSRWNVVWLLVLLVAIGGWAVGFWLAYLHRSDSEWANYASIAGLGLAIVGFPVTIYSLFETQRAGREVQRQAAEAAREAKEAVEQARVDTKQALQKVAMMLLAGDVERLHAAVIAVLDFAEHAIWMRALLHCREAAESSRGRFAVTPASWRMSGRIWRRVPRPWRTPASPS